MTGWATLLRRGPARSNRASPSTRPTWASSADAVHGSPALVSAPHRIRRCEDPHRAEPRPSTSRAAPRRVHRHLAGGHRRRLRSRQLRKRRREGAARRDPRDRSPLPTPASVRGAPAAFPWRPRFGRRSAAVPPADWTYEGEPSARTLEAWSRPRNVAGLPDATLHGRAHRPKGDRRARVRVQGRDRRVRVPARRCRCCSRAMAPVPGRHRRDRRRHPKGLRAGHSTRKRGRRRIARRLHRGVQPICGDAAAGTAQVDGSRPE